MGCVNTACRITRCLLCTVLPACAILLFYTDDGPMKPCLCPGITGVLCLVLVLVVLPPALHAQTTPPGFTHQVFTTDDGLPTNLLRVRILAPATIAIGCRGTR